MFDRGVFLKEVKEEFVFVFLSKSVFIIVFVYKFAFVFVQEGFACLAQEFMSWKQFHATDDKFSPETWT